MLSTVRAGLVPGGEQRLGRATDLTLIVTEGAFAVPLGVRRAALLQLSEDRRERTLSNCRRWTCKADLKYLRPRDARRHVGRCERLDDPAIDRAAAAAEDRRDAARLM